MACHVANWDVRTFVEGAEPAEVSRIQEALEVEIPSSSMGGEPSVAPPIFATLPTLGGREVACRAVNNWLPAQTLRARGRTICTAYAEQDDCQRQAARAIASFLNLQACHQEDIAAANGLRAYYTRIALAEQLRLSEESQGLVDDEREKQQAAHQSGLATRVDSSSFLRRKLEIEDLQLQLRSQDRQLRDLLAQLAQTSYEMEEIRQEALDVQPGELNCQGLVTFALAHRYDMRSWQGLQSQINDVSAPIFAQLLSTALGGFGLPLPIVGGLKGLLCPTDLSGVTNSLRQELKLAVETQRRWIERTVLEKCAQLQLSYQRLKLAQQTVDSWQERRSQLQQLRQLGQTEPEQNATAQIGWLQARGEEIRRRLEARLAEVDLAEAVGQLSHRCCTGQAWLIDGQ